MGDGRSACRPTSRTTPATSRSWLRKLRDDKREIFRAAAAAQRIADYCLAFHPDYRRDTGTMARNAKTERGRRRTEDEAA